jgi:U3 small nucleolar RNA-associated protein 14
MSLKHKGTTKWAKKQAQYAKYNDKARELMQEQLDLSKQLTKKVKPLQTANEDDDDDDQVEQNREYQRTSSQNPFESQINIENALLANNPWMKMMSGLEKIHKLNNGKSSENENDEKYEEFAQPKAYVNKRELQKAQADLEKLEDDENDSDNDDHMVDRSQIQDLRDLFDKNNDNDSDLENQEKEKTVESVTEKKNKKNFQKAQAKMNHLEKENQDEINETEEVKPKEKNIKPLSDNNSIKFNKLSDLDQSSGGTSQAKDSYSSNNKKSHQLTLSEAFADDDVIEEFRAEKREIVDSEKVKPIDLTKPGWGDWAGAGIDPNEQKKKLLKKLSKKNNRNRRKKLFIRPQDVLKSEEDKKQMIRRDKDLPHVIISEKKDSTIAKFQVI